MNDVPTENEIMWVFAETPDTVFVTISRAGAAWINQVVLRGFYPDQTPLLTIGGDPDANSDNYDGTHKIRNDPLQLPVHLGMKIVLTRNIDKTRDYVNGMEGTVVGVYRSGVRVRTKTNYEVMVFPWTDETKTTFLPLRLGYASTLLKVQGATLEHITMYLDVPNVEAAGYVAMCRVKHDRDWKFVGNPTVHHFTPATCY